MRQPPRVVLTSALAVGAVLVFSHPVRATFLSILRFPFTMVKACVQGVLALPHLPRLASENARLRTEAMQRQLEVARLREALRHAEQADALFLGSPSPDGLIADVIGRSTVPTQHTVLLNKGRRDGLTLESVILDASGLVGRVVELHPSTCLVLLLTDPESRVAGLVERSRENGLLVGNGRGRSEFIYLDLDADIEVGDRLVTAGLGGPFPKGLLLGRVVRVVRDEISGSASALVEPAARLSQLEEVLCLPPHTHH